MGILLEPEEMNDYYQKTAHVETRDKGFTLLPSAFKSIKNLLIYRQITQNFII